MKHLIIVILALAITIISNGKSTNDTTDHNTWSLKGKVFPWTVMAASGINYSLGVEYGFKKVHAIGIDAAYNDYSFTNEEYDSARGYYFGPRQFTVVRGLFLNYKRYLHICDRAVLFKPISKLFKGDCLPYIGLFGRYGKSDVHYQPGYVTKQIAYDEWQYSLGALFGVLSGAIDMNIGPFYKTRIMKEVRQDGGLITSRTQRSNFGIRVGFNFFLVVKRIGDHYLVENF
ncbi:MAG: hypothetical protein EBX41_11395 [Chitinophagia bacterium]|nr:hypothetical protein [Chitinophagia bacterium]